MATNAHTETSGKKPFPPFQTETFASQLAWLAITFVILYVVMAKLAVPRIGSIIDNRQKRIEGDIAEAQSLKAESDAAIAAYEKALADARNKAQAIAGEMRDKQAKEAEVSRKSLEESLAGKLASAETTIAATKTKAMANVATIAKDAAAEIVARLIGKPPSDAAVEAAVADVLKR